MEKDMPQKEKTEVSDAPLNIPFNCISESGLELLGKVKNHKNKAYAMECYNNKEDHKALL